MANCEHLFYAVKTSMVRIRLDDVEDGTSQLVLKFSVTCSECGKPYRFRGEAGFSTTGPSVSKNGLESFFPVEEIDFLPPSKEGPPVNAPSPKVIQ